MAFNSSVHMVLVKKAADCSQIFHIYSFKGDGRLKKEISEFPEKMFCFD